MNSPDKNLDNIMERESHGQGNRRPPSMQARLGRHAVDSEEEVILRPASAATHDWAPKQGLYRPVVSSDALAS